jgi:hypothetical protein
LKVFLSWSKTRSKRVAQLLYDWIPCVIQSVDPWLSSQKIEDGELWFSAIQTQVAQAMNGIICLTKENQTEPWILFEAGGLAKGLDKNRIYVLLIDLNSDDILLNPLSAFNHTRPTSEGMRKLLQDINARLPTSLRPSVLDQVFDKFWSDFESALNLILEETQSEEKHISKKDEKESDSLILKELYKSVKALEKKILLPVNENSFYKRTDGTTVNLENFAEHRLGAQSRLQFEIARYKDTKQIDLNHLPRYAPDILKMMDERYPGQYNSTDILNGIARLMTQSIQNAQKTT